MMHGLSDERKQAFAYNYALVRQHNSMNTSWTLELNEFAAMPFDEFRQRNGYKRYMRENAPKATSVHKMSGIEAPSSIDWRPKLVNPVKNQGQCGSCWTFSTVASLESAYAKLTSSLEEFSEQDLVDCVKNYQGCCNGCQGGLMDYAFGYMKDDQSGADDMESNYPYTAKDGTCVYSSSKAFTGATVTGFVDVTSKDEDALMDAVATQGVISIAVNAAHHWQLYSGGILDVSFLCNPDDLDHGVAVVGYGTEDKDYWIVRNSWGPTWGEEGYIRLVRGKNMCGVATQPSYPTMETAN
jgi:C1A family cysteine protease